MLTNREAGVLLHITSLPSDEGIGTLGKSAFGFIDWLSENGFSIWQVLPLCHAGYAQSPYLALSAFAGNPLMIDLRICEQYYNVTLNLPAIEFNSKVDFESCYSNKLPLLNKFADSVKTALISSNEFIEFCNNESYWLNDYSLFAAFREKFNKESFEELPLNFRLREAKTLEVLTKSLADEMLFYKIVQFEFFRQWNEVRSYAASKGIKIMGDLPIYMAYDSCEVWRFPELFSVNEELLLTEVAGVPPDYFSETGQLWGNPVYKWENHKAQNYEWWKMRMKKTLAMFDLIRIDHFRAFASYWEIPAGSEDAVNGKWVTGPGMDFFNNVISQDENDRIVAEDLGVISEDVVTLLKELGFHGMKVIQFAFDESNGNTHKPHFYPVNSIVYTGTHDNDTLAGWLNEQDDESIERICRYLACEKDDLFGSIIRACIASVAAVCILPMQDILELSSEARMNIPGTTEGNWKWRMNENFVKSKSTEKISEMIEIYERKR